MGAPMGFPWGPHAAPWGPHGAPMGPHGAPWAPCPHRGPHGGPYGGPYYPFVEDPTAKLAALEADAKAAEEAGSSMVQCRLGLRTQLHPEGHPIGSLRGNRGKYGGAHLGPLGAHLAHLGPLGAPWGPQALGSGWAFLAGADFFIKF